MAEKQKVLIVDDEPRNQRIIIETLDDFVEIKTAASGEEALQLVTTFDPDLVLLDIMMPGIDGYEVCRKIRSDPKNALMKVILVSGKAMIEERLSGYAAGADDYMTKPFAPEELMAKSKVFLRLTLVEKKFAELNLGLEAKVQERTRQLLDAEAKMITSAKMSALGEMAGGVAHEINTPLAIISMTAEQIAGLAGDEPLDPLAIIAKTKSIVATVQRISKIIGGLRTFSRDGSQERFDAVSLKRILEDTLTLCKEKLKNNDIQLECDSITDDLKIHCRAVQISQVLLNLIGNACDAITPLSEKWIKIEAQKSGNSVLISITDSGLGIPQKIRDKLFQPFFTTKEVGKGTGLGLSISKGIMDAHHGRMYVDPDCPHTRFILEIPSDAPQEAEIIRKTAS